MQGVLIVSSDPAVRKSLHAILQSGRTIHERPGVSEALTLAASQRLDFVFVDDVFADGTAEDLVQRLHGLGYASGIVPMLFSRDPVYVEPFRRYGVRRAIAKPFDVAEIQAVVDEIVVMNERSSPPGSEPPPALSPAEAASAERPPSPAPVEAELRKVAQRLQRLLARSRSRADLIQAFSDAVEEQFDVDNVVVLLPAEGAPELRVYSGDVVDEVREQFSIPLGEPVLAALARLGEPVAVQDEQRLGGQNLATALRFAERLRVQTLCPVLSRGQLCAVVGLSRSHGYGAAPSLASLLRVFLSFFAKALEAAEVYEQTAAANRLFGCVLQSLPAGIVTVAADGAVTHVNHTAAALLGVDSDGFAGLPVERLDSRLAGIARDTLAGCVHDGPCAVPLRAQSLEVTAVCLGPDARDGALLMLSQTGTPGAAAHPAVGAAEETEALWRDMANAVAHNFKNALVPVKTCAELLPERYADQGFRDDMFGVTRASVERVDRCIEQLMQVGQLGEARPRTVFALHEAVEKGLSDALSLLPDECCTISREYGTGDSVDANLEQVERLFFELASNALAALEGVAEAGAPVRVHEDLCRRGAGLRHGQRAGAGRGTPRPGAEALLVRRPVGAGPRPDLLRQGRCHARR